MSERPDLLTIDAGNSTLDCLSPGGARLRLATRAPDVAALARFARESGATRVAAVAVVEAARAAIEQAVQGAGLRLRFAGSELPCPLPVGYDTPDTLGADRWVAALAAHAEHGRAVIVDAGTATTVDLVEQDGTFCGGAIAPGLRAFAAGLAALAPALPAPELDAPAPLPLPARSSRQAVEGGVLVGHAGLVERLVADMLRSAGGPARVVVTGGEAERLLRHSRLRAQHVPDLVHRGLVRLDAAHPAG